MFFPVVGPVTMHIPNGFLNVPVSLLFWVISAAVIAYALRRVNADLGERQIPLLGVLAAVIFAGQMLNFSITGGTSGHLMGAALAAIVLGPWAAIIVMACVVGVQALLFQDGGLLALGANIFNMGVVGVMVAWPAYRFIQNIARSQSWGLFVGGGVAAWLSVTLASLAVALQLWISGTAAVEVALPAMGGIHMLIGLGEALMTVGALAFIYTARRDLLTDQPVTGTLPVWLGGLGLAVALAVLSPLASAHPDGLEWVAEELGFLEKAQPAEFALIPDYVVPGVPDEALATILAGLIGVAVVALVAGGLALARRKKPTA